MKKYWLFLVLALFMVGVARADTIPVKPYQTGDWKMIAKSVNGTPLAIHFWGVTCPACVKEMPQWGSFVRSNPGARVIFIQVDDVSADSIKKMLSKAGLEKANNYSLVSPFDERLRYEIDPQWHGETPTTFILGKNGKVTRKTGPIDFRQLQSTLNSKT